MDVFLSLIAGLLGSAALALRPPATAASLAITLATGAIGGVTPVPASRATDRRGTLPWLGTVAIGVGAFAAARLLQHPVAPKIAPLFVAATGVAGVAEELLFRRLLYGALSVYGAFAAVMGAAVVFGAVHIPAYGAAAFPIDLAAGLIFGWQRWASGSWTAPAATHAVANLLQAAW